jgi:hypothetical protein
VLTYWKYAPRVKIAAALLDDFFDHSRRLLVLKSFRAYTGFFARNIQQAHHITLEIHLMLWPWPAERK